MNLYYDPSHVGSLGGAEPLARATNTKKQDTLNWLQGQRTYTLHKLARKNILHDHIKLVASMNNGKLTWLK